MHLENVTVPNFREKVSGSREQTNNKVEKEIMEMSLVVLDVWVC